jgi:methionyl-tRNA formyltransferase
MAPLPEFRGCNQFSFAIIRDKKEFGTTIHILEEGIDSGAILFESRFPIASDIWVSDLYERTFEESIKLFKANLHNLISGSYKPISQEELLEERGSEIHYRKEIEEIKNLDLDWTAEKISRHIRATYFPGFEPPYFLINEQKVHIKIEE